ncbi:MAG TPA: hypothetical protein VNO20_02475 [Solirubrobacterales bacterium]|nr:hypothetical protein [Solirubrobacterales bacterium]
MESSKVGKTAGDKTGLRLRLALAAVLAIGLVLWIALRDDDGNDSPTSSSEAQIVSVDSLRDASAEEGVPIYWAGEQEGAELELSRPDADRTYVRYLTGGAEAGDPQPDFLTVGTYEDEDALAKLKRQGKEPGGVLAKAPGGATVYFNRNQPSSVYLAYPGVDAQIEVYDPDFKRALQLVNSGQIVSAD